MGEFETGDIYLLGANLPHTFQKSGEQITSAVVVQFKQDFWGREFTHLPESRPIKQLFETCSGGLKISGSTKQQLIPLIKQLEFAKDFKRVLILCQCMDLIACTKEFVTLSTLAVTTYLSKDKGIIDTIVQHTIDSFRDPISLGQIAAIACMSVPAFCNYFKHRTKKTYIEFLNEVRIGYACSLLTETKKTVIDIGYESGYNTTANFHKQFFKIKKLTPLQFRKRFDGDTIRRGNNFGIEIEPLH